jgi:hypothetical protein
MPSKKANAYLLSSAADCQHKATSEYAKVKLITQKAGVTPNTIPGYEKY